jgi:hypothetical protein
MRCTRLTWLVLALIAVITLPATGCKALAPSNDRDWTPDQAVLPSAELRGDVVDVHNVRDCSYVTADDYVVNYYDKTFRLADLDSVDFIVVPFKDSPQLAHTMLSFGFRRRGSTASATNDRDYLAVSVEIRKERGESFDVVRGALRQYEIMYVLADERDVIDLRANYRRDDVFIYRALAGREKVRELFVDVMDRVNHLAERPEFYNTVTNNCTTNIVRHINRLSPHRVPWDHRILLPGASDRLAYDLGLLDTDVSFEETRRRARINDLAARIGDGDDFSNRIRQARGPDAPTRQARTP